MVLCHLLFLNCVFILYCSINYIIRLFSINVFFDFMLGSNITIRDVIMLLKR